MTERTVSPQTYARTGGVLYLIIIVAGLFAELLVRGKLIVSGDATATAKNITSSELLFRSSAAIEVVWLLCAVGVTLILYVLLRPVSQNLALLAAMFNLVSIAVEAVATGSLFAALFFLGHADYLKTFEPKQLHTLAYLCLKIYDSGFAITLVFFACCLFVYGYLVYKSTYFPRTIGVLLVIASLSYLINSFMLFLAPGHAPKIFPILVFAFVGESSFCLWLMVKGVDIQRWEERASAGG